MDIKDLIFCWVLLLLINLLPEVYCKGRYKEACKSNPDCIETNYCEQATKHCTCITTHRNLHQYFDFSSRKCLSLRGSICTRDNDKTGQLANFDCVPNAECKPMPRRPPNLGQCECRRGYQDTREHLCEIEGGSVVSGGGSQQNHLDVPPLSKYEWAKSSASFDLRSHDIITTVAYSILIFVRLSY